MILSLPLSILFAVTLSLSENGDKTDIGITKLLQIIGESP
jgi:hypothetical protein